MKAYLCRLSLIGALLVVMFAAGDALAVDGNYTSPYASQWDNRSTAASISNETFLGGFLVLANLFTMSILLLRDRKQRQAN